MKGQKKSVYNDLHDAEKLLWAKRNGQVNKYKKPI